MSIWKQSEKEKLFISQYRKTSMFIFDIIFMVLALIILSVGFCLILAPLAMTSDKIPTLNFHDTDSLIKWTKSFAILVYFIGHCAIGVIFTLTIGILQSKSINKQTKTAAKWPIILAAGSLIWRLIVFIEIICAFVMLPQLTAMTFSFFLFLIGICIFSIGYTIMNFLFLMRSIVYYNVLTGKTTFDRFKTIK